MGLLANKKLLVLIAALSSINTMSYAYDLPSGINLGYTSFYDGAAAPAGSGWYFVEYLVHNKADSFKNSEGKDMALPKQSLEVFVPTTQLFYVGEPLQNGMTPGFSAILPWLTHANVDDGLGNMVLDSQEGLGDLVLGGFVQLNTIMDESKIAPKFMHRVELDVFVPTGKYDPSKAINPGTNFWSVSPYYAFTYWMNHKLSTSSRLMYIWNGENDKPLLSHGEAQKVQAGQAIHGNTTIQYALNDKLSLGLNGYWLKQLTDTKVDGEKLLGSKEQVWAIGPGFSYSFSRENILNVNTYFEQDAKNRTEGNKTVLNFIHKF